MRLLRTSSLPVVKEPQLCTHWIRKPLVNGKCKRTAVADLIPSWDALTVNNRRGIMDLTRILSIMMQETFTEFVITVTIDGTPGMMMVMSGAESISSTPPAPVAKKK
jgi:hypothetical protein